MKILLVDDDDVDVMAVRRAFRERRLDFSVVVARDGIEALAYLRGQSAHDSLASVVVLLDLNMPRMNGIEFLGVLRADPALCHTVVFVLTTSSAEDDRRAAYRHAIAGYLLKDRVGVSLAPLVDLLESYANVVELPR